MLCLSSESFWGPFLEEKRAKQDNKQCTVRISAAASVPGEDFEMAHFSAFPHPESCMNSCFHPATFPIPSSCVLDNTTLFPVALFSPEVFFFSRFELCFSTARLCSAIHEVERGEDEGGEKLCRCRCTGRLLQIARAAEELAQAAGALRLCRELRRQPAWDECKFAAGE